MNSLKLRIVTPEKEIYDERDLDSVSIFTAKGQITILPNHIPLVTRVTAGEVTIKKGSKTDSLITTEGFLQLDKTGEILVLADYAVRSEDIEIAKVMEAKKKAEEALKAKVSERDFIIAEAELRRTLLELKISQKQRRAKTKI